MLTLSETEVTVRRGGFFEWTVVLGALPEDTVTVAATHSDGDNNLKVAKASASLTFTTDDWATPQTVRVRAPTTGTTKTAPPPSCMRRPDRRGMTA